MNNLKQHIKLTTELQQLISSDTAWNYQIVPIKKEANQVTFICNENSDTTALKEELEILTPWTIELIKEKEEVLKQLLGKHYRKSGQQTETNFSITANNQSSDFLLRIINEAKSIGSSDIHIEIYEDKARIRIRIDGALQERYTIDIEDYPELVNKIKIKSNLNITEKRLPQDGRITFDNFDVRVSILPTLHGEKVVLRILSRDASQIDLDYLGFTPKEKTFYLEGVNQHNGIVLISGPTGSGKTTTLYATLKLLNKEKTNIVTVEDPIEYTLEGINQVQLKENIGLTFSSALRSFLRQDPDIIMLGEIRDVETAQMAIRAAQTGHLVLSTIHTNSAWGTIARLIDMGIPPYLLASTINTTVAQRLVKVLCADCKQKDKLTLLDLPKQYRDRNLEFHYTPVGCENCNFSGYQGRKAIYEVITIDEELVDLIKDGELKIDSILKRKGIQKINEKAFTLLEEGITSLEEVYALLTTL